MKHCTEDSGASQFQCWALKADATGQIVKAKVGAAPPSVVRSTPAILGWLRQHSGYTGQLIRVEREGDTARVFDWLYDQRPLFCFELGGAPCN